MFTFSSSPTVCYCIGVDEATIVKAIQSGDTTLSEIKKSTKACTGTECKEKNPSGKCCSKDIKALIALHAESES